jgi:hypothetical protein
MKAAERSAATSWLLELVTDQLQDVMVFIVGGWFHRSAEGWTSQSGVSLRPLVLDTAREQARHTFSEDVTQVAEELGADHRYSAFMGRLRYELRGDILKHPTQQP